MKRWFFYIGIFVCFLCFVFCPRGYARVYRATPKEKKVFIETKAEKGILQYKEMSFWDKRSFSKISALKEVPFDLFQFKKSKEKLFWEGKVRGVVTTIRLIFPFILDHCHEHVWPSR